MTFVNHGIAGGIIHGAMAALLWNNPIFITAMATLGGVFGMAPDILSFIDRKANPRNPLENWSFYHDVHSGWINRIMRWVPAWGYHTWIDRMIHPYPQHKGGYRMAEALHWAAYILLGWWWLA